MSNKACSPYLLPDSLIDLGCRFRKSKIWQKLWDTQIFAVKHSDGKIGYCCVMGQAGQFIGLADYIGEAGLTSYINIMEYEPSENETYFDKKEHQYSQNCLLMSFVDEDGLLPACAQQVAAYYRKNNLSFPRKQPYINFETLMPYHEPWFIQNDKEARYLEEALEAALFLSQKLKKLIPEQIYLNEGNLLSGTLPLIYKDETGIVIGSTKIRKAKEPVYQKFACPPEELERLKISRRTKKKFGIEIFLGATSCAQNNKYDNAEYPINPPFFPFICLIMDLTNDTIITTVVATAKNYKNQFSKLITDTIYSVGRPQSITVRTERTREFFIELCDEIGISLIVDKDNEPLLSALDGLADYLNPDINEQGTSYMDSLLNEIKEMCYDDEALAAYPSDELEKLYSLLLKARVPNEMLDRFKNEIEKRKR